MKNHYLSVSDSWVSRESDMAQGIIKEWLGRFPVAMWRHSVDNSTVGVTTYRVAPL